MIFRILFRILFEPRPDKMGGQSYAVDINVTPFDTDAHKRTNKPKNHFKNDLDESRSLLSKWRARGDSNA